MVAVGAERVAVAPVVDPAAVDPAVVAAAAAAAVVQPLLRVV